MVSEGGCMQRGPVQITCEQGLFVIRQSSNFTHDINVT